MERGRGFRPGCRPRLRTGGRGGGTRRGSGRNSFQEKKYHLPRPADSHPRRMRPARRHSTADCRTLQSLLCLCQETPRPAQAARHHRQPILPGGPQTAALRGTTGADARLHQGPSRRDAGGNRRRLPSGLHHRHGGQHPPPHGTYIQKRHSGLPNRTGRILPPDAGTGKSDRGSGHRRDSSSSTKPASRRR